MFCGKADAQQPWCSFAEHQQELLRNHPALLQKRVLQEQGYQQYLLAAKKQGRALITIPVVVHIVHDGDAVGADENISDAQVYSQMAALNEDYRKLNADTSSIPSVFKPLAADFEIEFCLAVRDPDGNPTTGIERINGGRSSWTNATADEFKPSTIWEPGQYINVWVMRLGGTSSGTLGYAQFPGMPDSTDGIVVDYKAFGTTGDLLPAHAEGKTLTHEIGHWMGLMHTWGDDNGACSDDDLVADTPLQGAENYGCPAFPHVSCGNGPNGDMFMNYMDYVDDDCSYMFTVGQKARADYFLTHDRQSILSSAGCEPLPVYQRDMAITEMIFPTAEICTEQFIPVAHIKNMGQETITSMLINYQVNGVGLNQYQWSGWIAPGGDDYIFLPQQSLPLGAHTFYVYLSAPNGGLDEHVGNEEALVSFNINSIGIGEPVPAEEDFEGGSFPSGWQLQNPNNDRAWKIDTSAGASSSNASAVFDNFSGTAGSNPRGTRDGLITPEFDFRNANIPYLTFDAAYARRTASSKDSLILYYSLDCGSSWKRIWDKTGSALATAADNTLKFVPQESEWRQELVWVNILAGQGKVKFKFENYSDWGNNLYLDNFKISLTPVSANHLSGERMELEIFPNPSGGIFHFKISGVSETLLRIELLDISGKMVKEFTAAGQSLAEGTIAVTGVSKGMYLLRCSGAKNVAYRKLLVQ